MTIFGKRVTSAVVVAVVAAAIIAAFLLSRYAHEVDKIADVTRNAGRTLTGDGGFNFNKETPGYDTFANLTKGCPGGKDCIPSIDDPIFESVVKADAWLDDQDVVFVLEMQDLSNQNDPGEIDPETKVRAYPQKILNWHEIVNDSLHSANPNVNDGANYYFAVTFCPLCGSSLAFDREVDGDVLEFGVSGYLHNNDLIMYDRQTNSLWQQITGEAIVGKHFGKRLRQIPLSTMRWGQFKTQHPSALVLSRDTGYSRNYERYPYGNYERDDSTLFPVEGGVDETLHPKAVVYGIEINGEYKAYPEEGLENVKGKLRDSLGGALLEISYQKGDIEVVNLSSGKKVPATRLFWFAWKAFHPGTDLYSR